MKLRNIHGSIFEQTAEALILPVDGTGPGMGGRLARAFDTLFPAAGSMVHSSAIYPVAAGDFRLLTLPAGTPFHWVYLASVLEHRITAGNSNAEAFFRSAYGGILKDSSLRGIKMISSGLPSGGWRIQPLNAFHMLEDILEKSSDHARSLTFQLCIAKPGTYMTVERYARNIGIEMV